MFLQDEGVNLSTNPFVALKKRLFACQAPSSLCFPFTKDHQVDGQLPSPVPQYVLFLNAYLPLYPPRKLSDSYLRLSSCFPDPP